MFDATEKPVQAASGERHARIVLERVKQKGRFAGQFGVYDKSHPFGVVIDQREWTQRARADTQQLEELVCRRERQPFAAKCFGDTSQIERLRGSGHDEEVVAFLVLQEQVLAASTRQGKRQHSGLCHVEH